MLCAPPTAELGLMRRHQKLDVVQRGLSQGSSLVRAEMTLKGGELHTTEVSKKQL